MTIIPLSVESTRKLIDAAENYMDVARSVMPSAATTEDPEVIESAIIGMCVATLIAQEGADPAAGEIKGKLIQSRAGGAWAGIGSIIGQLPVEAQSSAITVGMRYLATALSKRANR